MSGFRVVNHIRSAVFGSLFLRYPCYKCDVSVWRSLWIAQTHYAEDAEGIRAMMLSDDVSDDSTDDRTEFDSNLCGTERWRGVYRRRYIG